MAAGPPTTTATALAGRVATADHVALLRLLLYRGISPPNYCTTSRLLLPLLAVLLSDHNGVSRLLTGPRRLPTSYNNATVATGQWISGESFRARTDWSVIPDLAVGILSAGTNAGIPAIEIKTGKAA